MHPITALTTLLISSSLVATVNAETSREHAAHEHGHAAMDLILDGEEMLLEIHSPAYNLFGFEHAPNTAEQKAQVETVLKQTEQYRNASCCATTG